MTKKITISAVTVAVGLMLAGPAHATAYLIGGKWYYFSLDMEALIGKVSGKDLNLGTYVGTEVKIIGSNTECANPQSHSINPGQGPQGVAYGSSPSITTDNLTKANDKVTGNTYQTTATVLDLVPLADRLNPPSDLCKNPPGTASWVPLYWQDKNCSKGLPADQLTAPVCYRDLAYLANGNLYYLSSGSMVTNGNESWTFVYLPTAFKFKATLANFSTGGYDYLYGSCQFPANNEAGAKSPGAPYSITNPPVNGWAALPAVYYTCVGINESQYLAP